MNDSYCKYCNKQFKSKMSLHMHWMKSKFHQKGGSFYHNNIEIEKDKIKKVLKEKNLDIKLKNFKKIDEFI